MVMDMKLHQLLSLLQEAEVIIVNANKKNENKYFNVVSIIFLQLHLMVLEKQEEHLVDLVQDMLHIKF